MSADSIVVNLPQTRGDSEEKLRALEFVEPVLRDGVEQRAIGREDARGAGRAELIDCQLPIFRDRAIAVPADLLAILAEKHDDRDSRAAADFQLSGEVGMSVSIEKAELDRAGRLSEMVEDRALIHAIATPRAGQAEHFHLALETGKQLSLVFAQPHCRMDTSPSPAMLLSAVLGEKLGVGEAFGVMDGVVEHGGERDKGQGTRGRGSKRGAAHSKYIEAASGQQVNAGRATSSRKS